MRAAIQNADPRQQSVPVRTASHSGGAAHTEHTAYTSSPSPNQQFAPRTSSLDPDEYARINSRAAFPPERLFPSPPSHLLGSISESAETPSPNRQNKVRKNLLGGFRRVANAVKSAAGTRQNEGLAKTRSIGDPWTGRALSQIDQNRPRPIVNHHPFAPTADPLALRPPPDGSQSARPQQHQFSIYPASVQQLSAMSRHNMSMTSLDAYAQGPGASGSASSRPLTPGSRQRSLTQQSPPPNTSGSFYVSSQGSLERGVPAGLISRKAATILVASTGTNTNSSSLSSIGDAKQRRDAPFGSHKLPSTVSYDFGHMPSRYPMVSPVKPVSPLSPIVAPDGDGLPNTSLYPTRSRSMTIPSKDDPDGDARVPALAPRLPRKASVPQSSMAQRVAFLSANTPGSPADDDVIGMPSFEPLMDGSVGRSAGDLIHKQAVHNISSTDLNVNTRSNGSLGSRSVASAASSEDLLTTVPLSRILYTSHANGAGSAPQPSSPVNQTSRFSMSDPPYQLTIDPNYMNMMEEAERRQQEQEQAKIRRKNRESERIDIYDVLVQGPNGYVLADTQQEAGDYEHRVPENDSGIRVDDHQQQQQYQQQHKKPDTVSKAEAVLSVSPSHDQEPGLTAGSSLSIQTHGSVSEGQTSMVTSAEGSFHPGSPASPFSFNHSRFSLINQDGSLNLASFDFSQLDGYQKRLSSIGSMGSPPPQLQQHQNPLSLQRSESSRIVDRLTRKTNSNSNDGSGSGWFWGALSSDSPPDRAFSPPSVQSPTRTRSLAVASASLTPVNIDAAIGLKKTRLVRKARRPQQQQQQQLQTTSFSKSKTELGMWHDVSDARASMDVQDGRPSASSGLHSRRSHSIGTSNSSTTSHAVVAPRTSDSSIGSNNTSNSATNRRQFHPHYTSLHTSAAAHRGILRPGDNNNNNVSTDGSRNRFPIVISAESSLGSSGNGGGGGGRRRMRLMNVPRNYVPFDVLHSKSPASMSLENALTLVEGGSAHESQQSVGGEGISNAAVRQHSRHHRSRLHKRSGSALTTSELDEIMVRTVEVCHSIQMAIKVQHSTDSGLGSWIRGMLRHPTSPRQPAEADAVGAAADAQSLSSDNGSSSAGAAPESENDDNSPSLNERSVDITTNGSAGDLLWSSDQDDLASSSHHRRQSDANTSDQLRSSRRRSSCTSISHNNSILSQPNDSSLADDDDDDMVGRMIRQSISSYSSQQSDSSDSASGIEVSDPVKAPTLA
ncbi:hypothetical protein EV175_000186 [Coemansia sp. RSA 1933]|nr:hypothetical protein EV175_000186 [Coemansia sp. RSA 1933]